MDALKQKKIDRGRSAATLEILELKAGHVLGFFGRERPIDTIRLTDTVDYVRHRREHGVQDATIEKELRELRGALRWMAKNRLYDGDPGELWPGDVLRPATPRKRWLPITEYESLLLSMGPTTGYWRSQSHGGGQRGGAEKRRQWIEHKDPLGQDWRDQVIVYCYTGLRLSELYRIESSDISGDQLHVRGTKTEGSDRRIPLHAEAQTVLSRRSAEHRSGPLFPVVSRNRAGKPDMDAQERAWLRALKRGCERARIAPCSTNDLRRTFCSWAWQRGVAMELVIRWMGHRSSKMVTEVYAQTSPEHGREEIAKLPSTTTAGSLPRISHNQGSIRAITSKRPQRKTE